MYFRWFTFSQDVISEYYSAQSCVQIYLLLKLVYFIKTLWSLASLWERFSENPSDSFYVFIFIESLQYLIIEKKSNKIETDVNIERNLETMSIPDWILTFQRSFFREEFWILIAKCEINIILMSIRCFFIVKTFQWKFHLGLINVSIKIPSWLKSLKKLQKTKVFVHKKVFLLVWKFGRKTMCITEIFALFPL